MKHIKLFENFDSERKVYGLDELIKMEDWIKSFWESIENVEEDNIVDIFIGIEDKFGKDISNIIDGMYSADKLHYNQNGKTTSTGGVDTYEFIEKFEEIKSYVDSLIK
jgi:hypothetical protein